MINDEVMNVVYCTCVWMWSGWVDHVMWCENVGASGTFLSFFVDSFLYSALFIHVSSHEKLSNSLSSRSHKIQSHPEYSLCLVRVLAKKSALTLLSLLGSRHEQVSSVGAGK
jgi:hypothetical protein